MQELNNIPADRLEKVKSNYAKRKELRDSIEKDSKARRSALNNTLNNLKGAGVGVSVIHWRNLSIPVGVGVNAEPEFLLIGYPMDKIRQKGLQDHVSPKGGSTTVRLYYKGSSVQKESFCHEKDHFCRHFGLKVALVRAMAKGAKYGFPV